ncbi:ABC transporter permease [Haloimpatiens sp. FM7330]|uniref:ABC transporter permease n=1 Tax=Haloimpatiens sp. FM7330 TaxID=3298610 RepID=UPI0036398766
MKQLFLSEWKRMWNRKSTWFCFGVVFITLCRFAKYYLNANVNFNYDDVKYVTSLKLPSTVLNMSTMFFNIIIIFLIVMSVTSEYRSGQLRMIMTRAVSFRDIIKAKFLVIVSVVFIFLTSHFVLSTILGYLFFPHKKVKFRTYMYPFTISEGILYNLKYYIITFITLIAMAAVIMVICIVCKTTIGAVGASLTFILASAIYPSIYLIFSNKMNETIDFSSLISIQDHGILSILAQKPQHVGLIIFAISLYIIVFSLIAFNLFNDQDCYN